MSLINCKECHREVSDKAERCPHCGAPIKKRTSGCAMLLVVVVGLVLLGHFVSLLTNSTSSPAPASQPQGAASQPTIVRSDSLEHQLAVIDSKGYVADDDLLISRFRSLITQLADTFSESKQTIADTTVKAQQILKDKGIDEKVITMMEGMNQIFPGKAGNQKYSQMLSYYMALRTKGKPHEEAIVSLKEVLQVLSNAPR